MSVIINNISYFTGPLYTNNINSFTNISFINNLNYVYINATNISCNNISAITTYTNNISTTNNVLTLNKPFNYVNTNFTQTIRALGEGISTKYNISNTNGYINSMRILGGVIPTGSAYTYNGVGVIVTQSANTKLGTITIIEPGIYLLYFTVRLLIYTTNTNVPLTNMYTEIQVNNVVKIQSSDILGILSYSHPTASDFSTSNAVYNFTKMFLLPISSSTSIVDWYFNPKTTSYYLDLTENITWLNMYAIKIA